MGEHFVLVSDRPMIKWLIKRGLKRFGLQIERLQQDAGFETSNPIDLYNTEEKFNDIWKYLVGFTLVDKNRCFMIYQFARQVGHIKGDVVEVGVYKGGTAKLLAKVCESSGKTVHLFDTFSGMPPTDPAKDCHKEGDFKDTSLESVKNYLSDCGNILFYEELFPITAKPLETMKFCLVHVDVDIYRSVMDCCNFFYPRLQRGGVLIFDDYGFVSCPGAKKAVDNFFSEKRECPLYLPTGQCIVSKI